MKTTEERTAETILQQPKIIGIDGKEYQIAPPTTATLILVSGMISRLPQFGELDNLQGEEILFHALANAKDCEKVAEIAAVMIVGAREYEKSKEKSLLQRIFRKESRFEQVKNAVLNASPKKLDEIAGVCLQGMQVHDFFSYNFPKQSKSDEGDEVKNDSVWAMILGVCKNIGCTPDYALYEMSYANVILYSRATPTYEDIKESKGKKKKWDESLDADIPGNFSIEGEEVVRI